MPFYTIKRSWVNYTLLSGKTFKKFNRTVFFFEIFLKSQNKTRFNQELSVPKKLKSRANKYAKKVISKLTENCLGKKKKIDLDTYSDT